MNVRKIICCMLISLVFGCIHPSGFAEQFQATPAPPSEMRQASGALADGDWLKNYGGKYYEYGYDAEQTADGGFILLGDYSGIDHKILLIKTTAEGIVQWFRTYGKGYYGQAVEQTSDNGYIVAGTFVIPDGRMDMALIKTDTNGVVEWEKIFDISYLDISANVLQTSDGGFLLLGQSGDYMGAPICILKTDIQGNLEWSTLYHESAYAEELIETSDSAFVVLEASPGTALIKYDMNGNLLWERPLGGPDQIAYSMDRTIDGGFIIAGRLRSSTYDIWLVKTDSDGVEQWSKTYDYMDEIGLKVRRTNDNGHLILARRPPNDEIFLLKTDADGNENWMKDVAPDSGKEVRSLELTSDGGCIIAGTFYDATDLDAMLIKMFPPELSDIALLAPPDLSLEEYPPTFQWAPNGGRKTVYAVDFSFSPIGPIFSTYEDLHILLTEPKWTLPEDIWNQAPSGKQIFWRVRGIDLDRKPRTIITSDEVWSFHKQ